MLKKEIIIGGISNRELLILVKQLHASVRAGYGASDALRLGLAQAHGRMKQVLEKMIRLVEKGAYMHEAFAKFSDYFPPLFLSLIKTGEISGTLQENLQRLAGVISKEIEFRQKVRSAMTYPLFVMIAIMGLGFSVAFFILPNLLPLFSSLKATLPLSTRILLKVAELFDKHGQVIAIGTVGGLIAMIVTLRRRFARPFTHWVALQFPVIGGINQKLAVVRICQVLKSLLASGMPIDHALEIGSSVVSNYYYQNIMRNALPFLAKGEALAQTFGKHPAYFDPVFVQLVALGEKTGSLEDAFAYLSDYYESEVDERMKNLAVSLEPMLLIFVGLIVGFVAMAILGPIYTITGSLNT